MSKVSVIGVGNVGATCANVLAGWNIAKEIVLLDVREGYLQKKSYSSMLERVTQKARPSTSSSQLK